MKKFKMFFDIEKEEQWLNEQLQKGYRCTNISGLGIYTFEKTNKRYVIRLDFQKYLPKEKFKEYKEIYEDFGWYYINSPWPWFGGIRYWQKEEDDQKEIFSDRQSMSNYYRRWMGYSSVYCILLLFATYSFRKDFGLYHEGLWSMNGALFWKAFIFETPFVLLKLLPLFIAVLLGISFYKAYRKYSILKGK